MFPRAQIIHQPQSGHYPEKHFGAPTGEFIIHSWTWALFTKSDETEWVASFRGGESNKRQLEFLSDTPFVFVVSDGQGYVLNTETEEVVLFTSQDAIREVATNTTKSLVLFADSYDLFTINSSLEIKEIDVPFDFYFIWFKQLLGNVLEIEYEEMYTGEFKKSYLNLLTYTFS